MLTHLIVSSIVGASFTFSGEEESESRKYKKPIDSKIQKIVRNKISATSEISALLPTDVYPKEVLKQIRSKRRKKS